MSEHEVESIPNNSSQALDLGGEKVLLCNSGGQHFAIRNQCTHQDASLEKGRVRNGYVSCPLHGVRFNLETGAPMGELTRTPVETFPVSEKDDSIIISVG